MRQSYYQNVLKLKIIRGVIATPKLRLRCTRNDVTVTLNVQAICISNNDNVILLTSRIVLLDTKIV